MLLILAVAALTLIGCAAQTDDEGTVTVVIENRDGTFTSYEAELGELENKSEGVVGILELLCKREENPLSFDMEGGPYGKYVNSIGPLAPNPAEREFISVYTNIQADFDVSSQGQSEYKVVEYNGEYLRQAGVGISQMTVKDGLTVLFRIEAY